MAWLSLKDNTLSASEIYSNRPKDSSCDRPYSCKSYIVIFDLVERLKPSLEQLSVRKDYRVAKFKVE